MLVLSRKIGESIVIGKDIVVTMCEMHSGCMRLTIEAPRDVLVLRRELVEGRPSPEEWDAPADRNYIEAT